MARPRPRDGRGRGGGGHHRTRRNTRRLAAIEAGIRDVPVGFCDFDDEEAAFTYAVKNQRNRRNWTDAEILAAVKAVHKPKSKGGDRGNQHTGGKRPKEAIPANAGIAKNPGAEETADVLGISRAKVERALRRPCRN